MGVVGYLTLRRVFALTIIATLSAATSAEQLVKIEGYDWNGSIPKNQLVIVKNFYGSIRSRSNSDQKVFVHASYQKIGANPIAPKFSILSKNGNLEITVVYDQPVIDSKGLLRGRTDLSILFPPTVRIVAETTSGMIKIDKSGSDVSARTVSGPIKLTTTGIFELSSINGDISLRLRGMNHVGNSSAVTKSGKIKADIFSDMDIRLSAETHGTIKFNNNDTKLSRFYRRQGDANSIVELASDSGTIELNVVTPPELVQSVKPTKISKDLRNLPKSKAWQASDPIKDVNPKRTKRGID
jgi:hypothetical protein